VLDRLGLPAVIADFRGGSALAAAVEFLAAWELPSVTPNLFVWLPLLRRAAADGVEVVLDGEGGDEMFGCARYLVADRLLAGRPLGAVQVARRLPGMGERPPGRWVRRALLAYGVRGAAPYGIHERVRRRTAVAGWLSPAAVAALEGADDPWAWKRRGGPRWWSHLVDTLTDAAHALGAADQLRREGVLGGVDLRHPLRDRALVEHVLRLPPELAFDPRLDRPLARRAWADALPAEILGDDSKPVYNSLPTAALRGRDREPLRGLLADLHPDLARLVRPAEVERLLAAGGGDPGPAWSLDVWRLASLELWLERQEDPDRLARLSDALEVEPAVGYRRLAAGDRSGTTQRTVVA
jgi:asparagine synthase (glutamine-hydrolysing)